MNTNERSKETIELINTMKFVHGLLKPYVTGDLVDENRYLRNAIPSALDEMEDLMDDLNVDYRRN